VLTLDVRQDAAPLLSVFGGKITTYRRLAEAALEKLAPHLPKDRTGKAAGWSGGNKLPGGDFPVTGQEALTRSLAALYPFLAARHVQRLAGAYGTRASIVLGSAKSSADLGQSFGTDLTEAEVRYLMDEEWATTADDVLWRRSKLGLRTSPEQKASLAAFMAEVMAAPSAAMKGAA
jgi:glycerol-3-phosphate dehydrogenase